MATNREESSTEIDCRELKREDLLKFSNIFASEFNSSSLHDRVLVFEVMEGWQDGNPTELATCKPGSDAEGLFIHEINESKSMVNYEVDELEDANEEKENKEEQKREGQEPKKHNEEEEKTEEEMKEEEEEKGEKTSKEMEEKEGEEEVKEDGKLENDMEQEVDQDEMASQKKSPKTTLNKHKIFVHSSWLAVQSPYFRALFYSGMKESHSKEVIMKISKSELQPHLTLVEAMYRSDVLNDRDYSVVLEVLTLANKYNVDLVFKKCKYVLMSTSLTLEKCEHILERVNDLPDSTDLLGVLEKFLVKEFTPLDKTWTMEKFIELSEVSVRVLLSSNDLPVQCENTVFAALMKWINFNVVTCGLPHSSLLCLVRFELMTIDYLFDVVRNHGKAIKMPGFHNFLEKGLAYHGFSLARRDQLKTKPVHRPPCKDEGPTFSWIIDENVRNRLSTFSSIRSSQFWYQGYQMQLQLSYNPDSNNYGMYMNVLDMSKDSCLNLSWTAKSDLFQSRSIVVRQMYTSKNRGWGCKEVKSSLKLFEVPEGSSHTIDVYVNFN